MNNYPQAAGVSVQNKNKCGSDGDSAAAPFLQGVKVKKLEWTEYEDNEAWAAWEANTEFAGCYVIKLTEDGHTLTTPSSDEDHEFFIDAQAAAQADYEARILSAIETGIAVSAPSPRAQALEEAVILEALEECETYFDNLSDADHDETGFVPNEEMRILVSVRAAIRSLSQPVSPAMGVERPVEGGPERGKFYHKDWELSKLLEARNGGLVDHSGGEAWRYEYTSKDENGEYDMLYRHNVNASVPAHLPASPGASDTRPNGGSDE